VFIKQLLPPSRTYLKNPTVAEGKRPERAHDYGYPKLHNSIYHIAAFNASSKRLNWSVAPNWENSSFERKRQSLAYCLDCFSAYIKPIHILGHR